MTMIAEHNNIDAYFDARNGGFNSRYATYLNELQMLNAATIHDNNNNEEIVPEPRK